MCAAWKVESWRIAWLARKVVLLALRGKGMGRMARKQRIHYEDALYHVIMRGNNKDYIFRNDEDKKVYLEKLFQYTRQYGAKL